MARITVEDCLKNVDNRFQLVLVATKRARQLALGAEPKLPIENDKITVLALREIADNLIDLESLDKVEQSEEDGIEAQLAAEIAASQTFRQANESNALQAEASEPEAEAATEEVASTPEADTHTASETTAHEAAATVEPEASTDASSAESDTTTDSEQAEESDIDSNLKS